MWQEHFCEDQFSRIVERRRIKTIGQLSIHFFDGIAPSRERRDSAIGDWDLFFLSIVQKLPKACKTWQSDQGHIDLLVIATFLAFCLCVSVCVSAHSSLLYFYCDDYYCYYSCHHYD